MITLHTAATPNARKEKIPYAVQRCQKETRQLLEVLDTRLTGNESINSVQKMAT